MGKPPVLVAARKIIKTYFKQRAQYYQIPTTPFEVKIENEEAMHGLGSVGAAQARDELEIINLKNQQSKVIYDQRIREYKCLFNLYFLKSRSVLCRDIYKIPFQKTNRFYDKPDFKY